MHRIQSNPWMDPIHVQLFPVSVPTSGTICLSTSHLRRHSRFSDNDSRPFFYCSYQDTIIWLVCYYHHSSLLSGHLWSLQ